MSYTRVRVTATRRVTPRMVRVTLHSPQLADYAADGRPDEYCRVFFPVDGELRPIVDVDGEELASEDLLDAPMRNYTIRRFDRAACEIDIDFVVHAGGIAASWAATAAPGDEVALAPSHGDYAPAEGTQWQHLVADATALPALSRIVEERGAGLKTFATVVVANAGEQQLVAGAGEVVWRWVYEPDDDRVADALVAAVRDFARPPGAGYVWVAGENRGAREARRHLRHELELPWADYHTLGYWRTHAETWNRRYLAQRRRIEERLDAVEREFEDKPVDDLIDAMDQVYVDAGLED